MIFGVTQNKPWDHFAKKHIRSIFTLSYLYYILSILRLLAVQLHQSGGKGTFLNVTGKGQIPKNSILNQTLISPKCSLNTISDELKGKQCSPHSNIVRSSNVCAIISILVPTCIRMSLPKVA